MCVAESGNVLDADDPTLSDGACDGSAVGTLKAVKENPP